MSVMHVSEWGGDRTQSSTFVTAMIPAFVQLPDLGAFFFPQLPHSAFIIRPNHTVSWKCQALLSMLTSRISTNLLMRYMKSWTATRQMSQLSVGIFLGTCLKWRSYTVILQNSEMLLSEESKWSLTKPTKWYKAPLRHV